MFKLFKKYKKWIFLTVLLTGFIFSLRFPWNKTIQKAGELILNQLPLNSDPDKVKAVFFPPGLVFYDSSFHEPAFLSHLEWDEIKIHPAFSKLLALHPGVRVLLKNETSLIALTLWSKNKKEEEEKIREIYMTARSPQINLSLINTPSHPLKLFGQARFQFDFTAPEKNLSKATSEGHLIGSEVEIKDSLITTNLGPINLPDLKWSEVSLKWRLKEEELVIETLKLGTEQDLLSVQLRGTIELKFRRNRMPQPAYYDFQAKIEVDNSLKSSLTNTLDLFLFDTKTPLPNGTRYLTRIKGSGHKPPEIEKLDRF